MVFTRQQLQKALGQNLDVMFKPHPLETASENNNIKTSRRNTLLLKTDVRFSFFFFLSGSAVIVTPPPPDIQRMTSQLDDYPTTGATQMVEVCHEAKWKKSKKKKMHLALMQVMTV